MYSQTSAHFSLQTPHSPTHPTSSAIPISGLAPPQVEHASTGRASCKECKETIAKGELRIGKVTPSPFDDDGTMTVWYHDKCMFEAYVA